MDSHPSVAGAQSTPHKAPNYYLIWVILAVLTLAEVGVAFLTAIPKQLLIIILILMALWKAALVAMYYMHLKFEPKKLWVVALAPVPLAIILVVVVLAEGWGG
jgi:cytochrome c oxidase subunit 4